MGWDLQFTHYLDDMQTYRSRDQTAKALILLGYVERDFIRFYRAGRIAEGIQFAKENLARSRLLLNELPPQQKRAQLHGLVDILAFEGVQNHAFIYEFIQLHDDYHRQIKILPVTTARYVPWIIEIVQDFGNLAAKDGLPYDDHLESTLDIIYYVSAHLRDKLTVKQVVDHVNQRCNPVGVQRAFSDEMQMSIRDYINVKKIREAQRALLTTTVSVKQIAQELGFYDTSDFSKRFKREIGQTPLEYRQINSQKD